MTDEPKFQPGEIVRIVSTHPDKRNVGGLTSVVEEVFQGRGGRWRYKLFSLDCNQEYFFEDELETTGQFD